MSYYIYVLKSLVNGDIYVGSTEDVEKRFQLHNQGKVKSTKGYRPWTLLKSEEFRARSEAVRRERFLKTGQQKEKLRREHGVVAKW